MALPADYVSGTITLTAGSTAFTGTGTGWLAADFREGDIILDVLGGGNRVAVVAAVTGNGAGTLTKPWEGPTLANVAYRLRYQWDSGRVSAQSRAMIEQLGNGNLQSLAAVTGAAGNVVVFNGPGAIGIEPRTNFINGVAYDVQVNTLADRAAYDGQSAGFTVLVSNVGDGRSAIYSKASNAVGDWTDAAYVTGPVGPLPDVQATVTNTAPGTTATVTPVPITGGTRLDFTLPEAEGFNNTGPYNPANAYVRNDVVTSNGSTFIALQAVPPGIAPSGATPPVDTAFWQVLAVRGVNGVGTVTTIVPGANITVDNTDPTAPVISSYVPAKASASVALAGTDNETFMTPLRVRQALNAIFGLAPAMTRWAQANAQVRKFYGGNKNTPDVGGSTGGTLPAGRILINNTVVEGIRQNGYIRSVEMYVENNGPLSNSIAFQVRRPGGSTWDIVSQSETFTPSGTGWQTFNLETPMACAPGDKVAVWLKGDPVNQPTIGIKAGAGSFIYANGINATSGFTSADYGLCLAFNGVPPFAIVTGDSIQEGHNTATNWHSFYHNGPAGDINAEPFHALRSDIGIGFEYQNFAEGSTNWSQTRAKASAIASVAPRMVLALCGVNDIVQGRTWSQVLADLNAFKAALPATTTLFISEMLPYTPSTDAQALTIRTWNANLASWCAANGANLVLCHDAMGQVRVSTGQKDDLITAYHYSGGHLSSAGVVAYADLMKQSLESIVWL